MTKVSGSTTQEVGTLPEGVGQVSPLAVRPQLLLPLLCHAEAWQPFSKNKKFTDFSNRLIPASSSMSPCYQHRLSRFYLRTIALRAISHHVASPYRVPSHFCITSLHVTYSYRNYSLPQPAALPLSSNLFPALVYITHVIVWGYFAYPSMHAALPLHQICRSYLTIVLSCHPDPTSTRSSFWSPLPLPSIPMHCPCTSSTSHFVNKPIIILSSIWSST